MLNLETSINSIKGIGDKKAKLFNSLGIFDIEDLIHFYPRKYEDWSKNDDLTTIKNGETACVKAFLTTDVTENYIRKGMVLYKCKFKTSNATINVTIFNNKYLAKSLVRFQEYVLYGKVDKDYAFNMAMNSSIVQMSSPKIEKVGETPLINPIYPAKENLNSKYIRKIIKTALLGIDKIPETLDEETRKKYNLISLDEAVRKIHFPKDEEEISKARYRLIFEELLTLQLGLLKLKSAKKQETSISIQVDYTNEFLKLLPFNLTGAQQRAIKDCVSDMKESVPMNRLVQGDVGSGKTAVAIAIAYTAIKNGYQVALMAPTEILATQHFESVSKMLEGTDIKPELLTGSTTTANKRNIKERLINGEIDFLIGTHAIIQNDVEFNNLGLVITDEQHRFGVKQRAMLASKGMSVHTVVMSATPIPRTLGLILYGDLDISILDELPPGRQPIRTDVVDSRYSKRIYAFIKKAIDNGDQAYIICPMVEDNESDLKSVVKFFEDLSKGEFKDYSVGLLHGKMKPKDKDAVMNDFASNKVQLLIATTVVEVGVDVPNATIMVIENAERFGLSQLHQLRGRIGRGKKQSYCILISDSQSETAKNRLMIMKNNSDGFKIADEDLKARGPGDFFGNRQHGLPNLKIADMVNDVQILQKAQECAHSILKEDFNLDLAKNQELCAQITKMFSRLDY